MSEQENIQSVREFYAAIRGGDFDTIVDRVTDDVVWDMPGPPNIPFAARRFGRGAVWQYFARLHEVLDLEICEPRDFVAEGDTVVALGHYRGFVRETGREVGSDFAMVWRFRGGKIAEHREYFDTQNLVEGFGHAEKMLQGVSGVRDSGGIAE